MNSDLVNGLFELGGASVLSLSIRSLYVDKELKGYNPLVTAFFFVWGAWNCFFYPVNGLWWSFAGGLALASANIVYLGQMVYYSKIYPWLHLMNFWENMKWPADPE